MHLDGEANFRLFHLSFSPHHSPNTSNTSKIFTLTTIMSSENATEDCFQEFRVLSAPVSDNVFVASKVDTNGDRIVLWRHIQREIDGACRIKNGNKSVSFMTDKDFEE